MIAQYIVAAVLLTAIAALIIRLNISGRAEMRRRALLTLEEQQHLAADDAQWQQQYGP